MIEEKEILVSMAKFGGDCKGMCKDCAFRGGSVQQLLLMSPKCKRWKFGFSQKKNL